MDTTPGSHDAAQGALGNQPSLEETIRAVVEGLRADQWTSLPCIVTKASEDGHTISVKAAVKIPQRQDDGSITYVELPEFEGIPMNWPGAGGTTHTFGTKVGDEAWLDFSARGHGFWRQNGDVQPPQDLGTHALSNAVFRPGARSDPRKLKGVSTTSAQLRTDDKKSLHDLSETAVTTIREGAAHQVNGKAVQTEIGKTLHHVAGDAIQQVTRKFLHNCGIG
jgi:hypothetical protein